MLLLLVVVVVVVLRSCVAVLYLDVLWLCEVVVEEVLVSLLLSGGRNARMRI